LVLAAAALIWLSSGPAGATVLYSDGPVDGQNDSWSISGSFWASDSFVLTAGATVNGAQFVSWNIPTDTMASVDWAILTGGPDISAGGTILGSGTANPANAFLFTNTSGFDIYNNTFSVGAIALGAGTYWFELQNAVTAENGVGYWDMNGGPSSAWENMLGYVTSDLSTTCADGGYYPTGNCSSTFAITNDIPEPLTLSLFGAGLAGAVSLRRRKPRAS
jgi:hypothetical protein